MSLVTYEETRPWAKAIKAAVVSQKMPPWFADPKVGHFSNDRRLSDDQIQTLSAWVDNGAPEGDAKDKPAPRKFQEGWNLKPDMVIEMPNAFQIPASGTIDYQYNYSFPSHGDTDGRSITLGVLAPSLDKSSSKKVAAILLILRG